MRSAPAMQFCTSSPGISCSNAVPASPCGLAARDLLLSKHAVSTFAFERTLAEFRGILIRLDALQWSKAVEKRILVYFFDVPCATEANVADLRGKADETDRLAVGELCGDKSREVMVQHGGSVSKSKLQPVFFKKALGVAEAPTGRNVLTIRAMVKLMSGT